MTSAPPRSTRRAVDHSGRRPWPYLPGLDGLRAVAVIAVIAYHVAPDAVPGGFLGVEVFFVISGFLITRLLVEEAIRSGRLDLRGFWVGRIRRLVPALLVTLTATVAAATWLRPGDLGSLRDDVLAAVGYATNWFQIAAGHSYVHSLQAPSPLRHLWSLAVEEQFYAVWPLALMVLALTTAGRRKAMSALLVLLALASAVEMAWLAGPTNLDRVYLGTDTRLSGLAIGAALALLRAPRPRWWRGPVAIVALGGLAAGFVIAGSTSMWLYRGGFLAVDVASVAVISCVVTRTGRVARVLGAPLLAAVGRRSYVLYLFHWPVLVLTDGSTLASIPPAARWVVRAAIVIVASEVCHRFVELPVRGGAAGRWWASLRGWRGRRQFGWALASAALLTVTVASTVTVVALSAAERSDIATSLAVGQAVLDARAAADDLGPESVSPPVQPTVLVARPEVTEPEPSTPVPAIGGPDAAIAASIPDMARVLAGLTGAPTAAPPSTVDEPTFSVPESGAPDTTTAPPTAPPLTIPDGLRISAVGDSVMLGAAPALAGALGPGALIDARVNRTFREGVGILSTQARRGRLGEVIVVHLGNNQGIRPGDLDSLVAVAEGRPVLLIDLRCNRSDRDAINDELRRAAIDHPNLHVLDWFGLSNNHPEYFYVDGTHLRPEGAAVYAEAVAVLVARLATPT